MFILTAFEQFKSSEPITIRIFSKYSEFISKILIFSLLNYDSFYYDS